MSPTPAATGRSNGLDSLRALAITLVFAYHYMVFVSREATFGWASVVGWVGVDLFFVLSGYLIANQLLTGLAQGRPPALGSFYARRALRTLPVFWLVLAAYMLWPTELGGRAPPPLWRFLTFTQNIQLPPGTAFSHAWSLCIEEQFYLVLPLVLWLGLRWRGRVRQGWALMGLLLVIGITARALMWSRYGSEAGGQLAGYHPNLYYATLCRFDEFLPGVAVAMLKHFHPSQWQRLMDRGRAVCWWGLAATGLMLYGVHEHYYIDGVGYGGFMSIFGYSLNAMAFALLVLAALSPHSWLHRLRIPGALPLALWSYSIYLSHKAVAHVLHRALAPAGLPEAAEVALITGACVLVGALLYRAVERPFLQLRDQRWPLSPRPAPAA
jgi:peptidoglycan/LPS O-acetylase OafA/YrhL